MKKSQQPKAYETREAILAALAQLLSTTDWDRITVKDLVTCANISRSTFYRYFFSIDQALEELEDSFLDTFLYINRIGLLAKLDENSAHLSPTLVMRLEELQKDPQRTLALLGPHTSPRFTQKLTEVMRAYLSEKTCNIGLTDEELDLYISYCLSGHNSLVRTWLSEHPALPAETVAEMLNRLFYAPILDWRQ